MFNKLAGMIIENTFTSISKLIPSVLPSVLSHLSKKILNEKWNSEQFIQKISTKILFISCKSLNKRVALTLS